MNNRSPHEYTERPFLLQTFQYSLPPHYMCGMPAMSFPQHHQSDICLLDTSQTGTSIPHALSYDVTYHNGVAHGKACGIFLAAYLRIYAKHKPEDVDVILSLLGFETLDDFAAFLKEILGIVTLTEKDVLFYVERMMENTSKDVYKRQGISL